MTPQQPVRPTASNGFAIASLVLGIIGWVVPAESYASQGGGLDFYYSPFTSLVAVVMPILAVIFGHIGLVRVGHGARGRGLAIAGLVLGYLMLALEVGGLIAAVAGG